MPARGSKGRAIHCDTWRMFAPLTRRARQPLWLAWFSRISAPGTIGARARCRGELVAPSSWSRAERRTGRAEGPAWPPVAPGGPASLQRGRLRWPRGGWANNLAEPRPLCLRKWAAQCSAVKARGGQSSRSDPFNLRPELPTSAL